MIKLLYLVVTAGLLLFLVFGFPHLLTDAFARARLYTSEKSPSARVAIVFGAGLQHDGTPTAVLQDRIATAADLYFTGKVEKILMSGDNRFVYYNEPGAMFKYAVSLGVPPEDIVLDYAGRRTYDTCYRARHIFGIHEALLVTQQFHLPRALFICNGLDIKAYGVIADRRPYSRSSRLIWKMRELPATMVAWLDVWVTRPIPVLGKPEPIFPDDTRTHIQ
jgi:SanA protein